MRSISLFVVLTLFLSLTALSEESENTIYAVRTSVPPIIDGQVDEDVWNKAHVIDTFWQREPDDGKPATERTELRILYDDQALYIAFICYDSEPDKIVRRLTRRDRRVPSDFVLIGFDSYFDRKTAFLFEVNAAGVKRDFLMMDDGERADVNWDGIWDAAVAMRDDGWSVEFKIPFQTLRFSEAEEQIWGFNAVRHISRKNEEVWWTHIPRTARGTVSRAGILRGLYNLNPPRSLLILPYALAGATRWPSNQFPQPVRQLDGDLDIGLDLQYGLSNNTTLNLTINPDFGQVELDEVILNLTAFETFYPERRPFFIEGASIFRTIGSLGNGLLNTHMFYSRRIGSQPSRYHYIPDTLDTNEWKLKDNPSATPIIGALKLSGKTNANWAFGVLNATTSRTHKVFTGPNNDRIRIETEPLSNYSVGRVQYELPNPGSYIGGIVTSVFRENSSVKTGLSGGIDWQYNTNDYKFSSDGLIAITRRNLENNVQEGYHAQARIGTFDNRHINAMIGANVVSKDFNPNDIGFNSFSNFAAYYVWIQFRKLEPFWWIRRISYNQFNFTSHLIEPNVLFVRGIEPNFSITWVNYWYTEGGGNIMTSGYDPFESRGMGLYRRPSQQNMWFYSRTDNRKPVTFAVSGGFENDEYGGFARRIGFPITVNIGYQTEISISPSYRESRKIISWVSNVNDLIEPGERVSVFGRRDVDQINTTIRATHTFTPDITLQAYVQYFWARGQYYDFLKLEDDGRVTDLPVEYDKTVYRNPDFNRSALNLNFILRYEYRPGSTLFVVWTHSRFEWMNDHTIGAGSFFNRTMETPSTNVVMLKWTYAIGM